MPQAAIFDIDGTLVDSVDLHASAWQEALVKFGHHVTFEQLVVRSAACHAIPPSRHRDLCARPPRSASMAAIEPISPSACRYARRNTARRVSAVRIASGEQEGWPPRVVRGAAAHAATASSLNHTVKLQR
jgi:phosphoglycolate phosphatase-like HAD superfamily hydrolase